MLVVWELDRHDGQEWRAMVGNGLFDVLSTCREEGGRLRMTVVWAWNVAGGCTKDQANHALCRVNDNWGHMQGDVWRHAISILQPASLLTILRHFSSFPPFPYILVNSTRPFRPRLTAA